MGTLVWCLGRSGLPMSLDNRIKSLIAEAIPGARMWLHIVQSDLRLKVRITETRRDATRQAEVKAAGKSPLSFGFHNLGRAVDWACFDDNGVYLTDGRHPYYRKCGMIWEALGWTWGGQFGDYDHAELRVDNMSLREYLMMHPEARMEA